MKMLGFIFLSNTSCYKLLPPFQGEHNMFAAFLFRLFSSVIKFLTWFAGASAISGFFAAACSLPFDFVKTQIQKMQPDATGKYPYTGSLDCAMQTLKSGGPLKFYTGFPVYCVRIAPHVMVMAT
jgi:hypothetical protein